MKKIPSLFIRDYTKEVIGTMQDGRVMTTTPYSKPGRGKFLATEQVTPGCEWVIAGEGVATRKWDGTAVLFMGGQWFKRYDAKHGKTPPADFFEAQPEPDPITGHWPGWVPVNMLSSEDQYITEAIRDYMNHYTWTGLVSGVTFEAIGPRINSFKDKDHVKPNNIHVLARHGSFILEDAPPVRNHETLQRYLSQKSMEGIVFHHPDGRMCKVKRSDFGLPW